MALDRVMLALGVGFLIANGRVLRDLLRYARRRQAAVLVWQPARPTFFTLQLAIGWALVLLIVSNLVTASVRPGPLFGQMMMACYYTAGVPLARRVRRGFFRQGVWTDSRFLPYSRIGGFTWREAGRIELVLLARGEGRAFRLVVPGEHYGAARRLLRDQLAAHVIEPAGTGLDLGGRDRRDDV